MKFLTYDPHPNLEPGPPSEEMMAEMGRFMEEAIQAGVLVTTGALQAKGTRVQLSDGKFSLTDGAFIEAKELMGGFAVLEVESLDEAVEWCKRWRLIVGDGETEIVPYWEPEEFGAA
ncbi:MAG: YciI family protein [Anaerolineae bacterium]